MIGLSTEFRIRAGALLLFIVVIGLLLCSGESSVAESAAQRDKLKDPQFIAEGAQLFAPVCGTGYCHGTGGTGGAAPKLRGEAMEADFIFDIVTNGIPGTSMPTFKTIFTEEQRWKLVAFVMSPLKEGEGKGARPAGESTPAAKPDASKAAASALIGDSKAGKTLFFDSGEPKSCYHCHVYEGSGVAIGPELSKVGTKPARELFLSIVLPHEKGDPRYPTVRVTLGDGDKMIGLIKQEDEREIRFYDITELPAVLRTVPRKNILKIEALSESPMPRDYASMYTMKQLLDLVTFLKSSDPQSKSPVTLTDLF